MTKIANNYYANNKDAIKKRFQDWKQLSMEEKRLIIRRKYLGDT